MSRFCVHVQLAAIQSEVQIAHFRLRNESRPLFLFYRMRVFSFQNIECSVKMAASCARVSLSLVLSEYSGYRLQRWLFLFWLTSSPRVLLERDCSVYKCFAILLDRNSVAVGLGVQFVF